MTKKEHIILDAFAFLREGNNRAGVEMLYRQYYTPMYGIAFSVLKNENDSRDAIHNVVEKLLSINASSLPKANEAGWLYTVVKNESIDLLKKKSDILPIDESYIVSHEFEANEIDALIDMDSYQKMIKNLDPRRQEIVTLKVLGGFTHNEISKILNIPIGTVQWLYATAMAKLKKSIVALLIASMLAFTESVRRLIIFTNPPTGNAPETGLIPNNSFDFLIVVFFALGVLGIIKLITLCLKNKNSIEK